MNKNKLHPEFKPLSLSNVSHGALLNTDLNKAFCTCGKCGQVAEVDASLVLTSYPPKYNYHCPHCDNYGYVYCSEVFYDTKVAHIEPIPVETGYLATSCLICGEPVPSNTLKYEAAICEKCKKAILKLRKILED